MISENNERLFFHDLVNQTHGINLFLDYRICSGVGLEAAETKELYHEMKSLQSLIKDHYNFKHKNLINTYDVVTFDFAHRSMTHLIHCYLPSHQAETSFEYKGKISMGTPQETRDQCLVHYPTFLRIVTNLVKNISEENSTEVKFVFNYDEDGLHIDVRNKVFTLDKESGDLVHNLQEFILGENPRKLKGERGLGLESVHTLCVQNGGEFNFELDDNGFWMNHVFLPHPHKHFDRSKKVA